VTSSGSGSAGSFVDVDDSALTLLICAVVPENPSMTVSKPFAEAKERVLVMQQDTAEEGLFQSLS
jgi:hypothetical protein